MIVLNSRIENILARIAFASRFPAAKALGDERRDECVHAHAFMPGASSQAGMKAAWHARYELTAGPVSRSRYRPAGGFHSLYPGGNRVPAIDQGFFGCFSIRHATGQVWKSDQPAAAFVFIERAHLEGIVRELGHSAGTDIVDESQKLHYINRLDGSVERDGDCEIALTTWFWRTPAATPPSATSWRIRRTSSAGGNRT